jgi:hypothetical protein
MTQRRQLNLQENRIFVWKREADVTVLHNNVEALRRGELWSMFPVSLRPIRGIAGGFRLLRTRDPRVENREPDDNIERALAHLIVGKPLTADVRRFATGQDQQYTDLTQIALTHQPDYLAIRQINLPGFYLEVPTDEQITAFRNQLALYVGDCAVSSQRSRRNE